MLNTFLIEKEPKQIDKKKSHKFGTCMHFNYSIHYSSQ